MAAALRLTVVVAPDSFKGSLPAHEVAAAVEAGPARRGGRRPGSTLDVRLRPVADGGEGTVAVLLAAGWRPARASPSRGPTGEPVQAHLRPVPRRAPRRAPPWSSSPPPPVWPAARRPAGPARAATRTAPASWSPRRWTQGSSGSCSASAAARRTDGGTGLATALGARFLDRAGTEPLPPGGARPDRPGPHRRRRPGPAAAQRRDRRRLRRRQPAHRADAAPRASTARRRAPTPADVAVLDAGLARLAEVLRRDLGVDVDGACPAPARPAASAPVRWRSSAPGSRRASTCCSTSSASTRRWREPTWSSPARARSTRRRLAGKAPVGVARRARAAGVPVVVLAGRVDLDAADRAALARPRRRRRRTPCSTSSRTPPSRMARRRAGCCASSPPARSTTATCPPHH